MTDKKLFQRITTLAALAAACTLPQTHVAAQQVERVTLGNVPPDLIQQGNVAAAPQQPIDLGEDISAAAAARQAAAERTAAVPAATSQGAGEVVIGSAVRAAYDARDARANLTRQTRRPPVAAGRGAVERAVFERQPVRVPLPVGQERLITLPAPAALHVPDDMQQVARIEVIDKTIYATALVPFTPIRIVAELIDTGQQIPIDWVAGDATAGALAELEVSVVTRSDASQAAAVDGAAASADDAAATPERSSERPAQAVDMVDLTRHAARALYAPRRLAWAHPGVTQVRVSTNPLPYLLRGANVEAVPVGGWHSGQLSVTAVRVTNKSKYPLEIPLESIRGRWIAATAQHGRIGAAGSDTDTTAIYLVCDRAFEACLE